MDIIWHQSYKAIKPHISSRTSLLSSAVETGGDIIDDEPSQRMCLFPISPNACRVQARFVSGLLDTSWVFPCALLEPQISTVCPQRVRILVFDVHFTVNSTASTPIHHIFTVVELLAPTLLVNPAYYSFVVCFSVESPAGFPTIIAI